MRAYEMKFYIINDHCFLVEQNKLVLVMPIFGFDVRESPGMHNGKSNILALAKRSNIAGPTFQICYTTYV